MPWLSIILALLTFLGSKRGGDSTGKALVKAGLVGAGTYGLTHYTGLKDTALGRFDGYVSPAEDTAEAALVNAAPTDPGSDASEEDKAAYQERLQAWNDSKRSGSSTADTVGAIGTALPNVIDSATRGYAGVTKTSLIAKAGKKGIDAVPGWLIAVGGAALLFIVLKD